MKKYKVFKNIKTNLIFQIQEIDFERLNQVGELYIKSIDVENNIHNVLYDSIEEFYSENQEVTDEETIKVFRKLYNINYFTTKVNNSSYKEAITLYKNSFSKTNKFLYVKPFLDKKYTITQIEYALKYNTINNNLLSSILESIEKNKYFCSKNQFLKLIEIIKS